MNNYSSYFYPISVGLFCPLKVFINFFNFIFLCFLCIHIISPIGHFLRMWRHQYNCMETLGKVKEPWFFWNTKFWRAFCWDARRLAGLLILLYPQESWVLPFWKSLVNNFVIIIYLFILHEYFASWLLGFTEARYFGY